MWSGTNNVYVGSSDGKLYQIDKSLGAGQTLKSVTIGAGTSAVGAVALDSPNNLVYVGTDGGALYSVSVPLP